MNFRTRIWNATSYELRHQDLEYRELSDIFSLKVNYEGDYNLHIKANYIPYLMSILMREHNMVGHITYEHYDPCGDIPIAGSYCTCNLEGIDGIYDNDDLEGDDEKC